MGAADSNVSPPKMSLTNLSTGVTLSAQFNPTELKEALSANYTDKSMPGMSHPMKQFGSTSSETFPIELVFRATGVRELREMRKARRFLKSLCFPMGGSDDISGGVPPRVLFVWPGMISMQCIVMSLSFTHELFNKRAQSRQFKVAVSLSEIRDFRVTSEEVFLDNQLRYGLE